MVRRKEEDVHSLVVIPNLREGGTSTRKGNEVLFRERTDEGKTTDEESSGFDCLSNVSQHVLMRGWSLHTQGERGVGTIVNDKKQKK